MSNRAIQGTRKADAVYSCYKVCDYFKSKGRLYNSTIADVIISCMYLMVVSVGEMDLSLYNDMETNGWPLDLRKICDECGVKLPEDL